MGQQDSSGTQAAQQQAQQAYNKYTGEYNNWRDQYNQYREQADSAFNKNYADGNAKAFNELSRKQGIEQANEQLAQAAAGSTAQGQAAARAAGMGKGQAAMLNANNANTMYQNGYVNAANAGQQAYTQGAGQIQNYLTGQQGSAQNNMNMASNAASGGTNTLAQIGANQVSEYDRNMGLVSGIGGAAAGIGTLAMMSDKEMKQGIAPSEDSIDYAGYKKRLFDISGEKEEKYSDLADRLRRL